MNKKLKKGLTIGTTLAVIGGAAGGITAGVLAAKDHKTTILKFIAPNEEVMTDINGNKVTIDDLVNKAKDENQKTNDVLVKVRREVAFKSYDAQQKGSIKLQEMYFEYDKWRYAEEKTEKEAEKSRLEAQRVDARALPQNNDREKDRRKKAIESLDHKIKVINDRLTAINKEVDKINKNETAMKAANFDYNQSGFSSKYPHVLLKRSAISEKEGKKFDDKRAAFIAQYKTTADGEAAWIKEMDKQYHGATTKEEVINSQVYSQIQQKAFARFNFKINTSFTHKHKRSGKFSFLSTVEEKTGLTNKDDDKKLFFLSVDSKDPSEIFQDGPTAVAKLQATAGGLHIIKLQHFLISAKQDAKGGTLPWDVKKDTFKKLFQYYGSGAKRPIDEFTPTGIFQDSTEEHDKVFVSAFSDNAKGTIDKSGAMGIKSAIDHITGDGLASGFALGLADLLAHPSDPNTEGTDLMTAITTKVDEALEKELGTAGWNNYKAADSDGKNRIIAELVDNMTDDAFKKRFGSAFRDAFGGVGKLKLSYRLSAQTGFVVSTFGIHLLRFKDLSTGGGLQAQLEKDLKTAREEDSTTKIETNYAELFKNVYSQERILNSYMNDTATHYDKDGIVVTTGGQTFAEQTIEHLFKDADVKKDITKLMPTADQGDDAKVKAKIKEVIEHSIKSRIDAEIINKVIASISDKREKWIYDNLDKRLRDPSESVESIYHTVDVVGGIA